MWVSASSPIQLVKILATHLTKILQMHATKIDDMKTLKIPPLKFTHYTVLALLIIRKINKIA